jgi:hypothetical protein
MVALFLNGMMGALAPLSYLVYNSFVALANVITIASYNHIVITILNTKLKLL